MKLLDRVPAMLPGTPPPLFHGGTGEPLLLLHPGGTTWQAWSPILRRLAASREVLAPTMAGHLGADTPFRPNRNLFVDLADNIEKHLDAYAFDRIDIVGNSIGGGAALELARRGRARRVVTISPMGMQSPEQTARFGRSIGRAHGAARASLLAALPAVSIPALRRRLLAALVEHGEQTSAGLARHLLHAYTWCDAPAFAGALSDTYPIFQHPEEITVPVLIIWGDRDRTAPRDNMDRYLNRLQNAELVELRGAGHFGHLDEPERVTDLILDFLGEAAPR